MIGDLTVRLQSFIKVQVYIISLKFRLPLSLEIRSCRIGSVLKIRLARLLGLAGPYPWPRFFTNIPALGYSRLVTRENCGYTTLQYGKSWEIPNG